MSDTTLSDCQARIQEAVQQEKITASAAENINKWLTESRYAGYAEQVREHIQNEQWQALDDAFVAENLERWLGA